MQFRTTPWPRDVELRQPQSDEDADEDTDVVAPAVERVEPGSEAEGAERDRVAAADEPADQAIEADEGSAPLRRTRRGGAEHDKPHYRPWNRGRRFSRKARVPSR